MLVIDGKDAILGRLASSVAKELLKGNRVEIINAEKILISGRKDAIHDHYKAWMNVRNITNPRKGPVHYRKSADIVKRTVRGMIPYKKPKGKKAYKRLRVHQGTPENLAGGEIISVSQASIQRLETRRYIRLEDLSKYLGAKP